MHNSRYGVQAVERVIAAINCVFAGICRAASLDIGNKIDEKEAD